MNLGKFICYVENEYGDNQYTYEVIVYDPPTIEDMNLDSATIRLIAETSFSYDCLAQGIPKPQV